MNYRNKKLTQSARHESCVACGADDGTIVWAHSNELRHGKGTGIKSHDLFGMFICAKCHHSYDCQAWNEAHDKKQWFREQWEKSMIRACEKSYL